MGVSRPAWFAAAGLGTPGGERTECGVPLERGVHLRWQPARGLGFPLGGFDVLRRTTLGGDQVCPDFDAALDTSEGTRFEYADATFLASRRWTLEGPPRRKALRLAGRQSLTITFDTPVRHVSIELGGGQSTATATAWWDGGGGALVDRAAWVGPWGGNEVRDLYADRIDRVVLQGVDLLVTAVCWLPEDQLDDTGWEWLTSVTVPRNAFEAAARLPAGSPPAVVARYAAGYRDVRPLLVDLATAYRTQEAVMLAEAGASASGRPAPEVGWPALDVLGAAAIDPLVARVLGLYAVDETAADGTTYDYKIVGHWKQRPWPGRHVTFDGLVSGGSWTVLTYDGLVFASPRLLRPDVVDDGGTERASLRVSGLAQEHAPVSITWSDEPVRAVTVRVLSDREVDLVTYHGVERTGPPKTLAAGGGELTLEDREGLTRLEILGERLDLVELVLRPFSGDVGDLEYISHRHAVAVAEPVRTTDVLSAETVALRPPADAGVTGEPATGAAVGLRWSDHTTGEHGLLAGSPVRLLVSRGYRGGGDAPTADDVSEVVNASFPALLTTPEPAANRPDGWPAEPFDHVDHPPAAGWWEYTAQGIDLFGRLAEPGRSAAVELTPLAPPPCPANVKALWLDPDDPQLPPDDAAWARANGTGVRVDWDWPGWASLRCPQLDDGGAEFRVHWLDGVTAGPTGCAPPEAYARRLVSVPVPGPSGADGPVTEAIDLTDGYARVGLDAALTLDADDAPGSLATDGAIWPARVHLAGAPMMVEVAIKPSPSSSAWMPTAGRPARYRAARRMSVRCPVTGFEPAAGSGTASAWLAVSTVDGDGRESCASVPARVEVVDRRVPAPPAVPVAPERLWAPPADYFGRSPVALSWSPAPDATGYVVLRASVAALLATGSAGGTGDGPAPDDAALRALAAQASSEAAFRSVTEAPVPGPAWVDTIDGRGRGAYVWRVRSVSAAGVHGAMSAPIGPVWVTPVTPPPTPVVTSVVAGHRTVALRGRTPSASHATSCRVYRSGDAVLLADVRRTPPLAVVDVVDGQWAYDDAGVSTAAPVFYAVTAVDEYGNASAPTAAVQARAVDVTPPPGPDIDTLAWVAGRISVTFTLPPDAQVLVERRETSETRWRAASPWLATASFDDEGVDPARSYAYRLLARTPAGVVGEPGRPARAETELTL